MGEREIGHWHPNNLVIRVRHSLPSLEPRLGFSYCLPSSQTLSPAVEVHNNHTEFWEVRENLLDSYFTLLQQAVPSLFIGHNFCNKKLSVIETTTFAWHLTWHYASPAGRKGSSSWGSLSRLFLWGMAVQEQNLFCFGVFF